MNDREMLEYAAKAAGYYMRSEQDGSITVWTDGGSDVPNWNPLNDDGDAFRLAVKLEMFVDFHTGQALNLITPTEDGDQWLCGDLDDDYDSARMAIVLVAAQKGLEMEQRNG